MWIVFFRERALARFSLSRIKEFYYKPVLGLSRNILLCIVSKNCQPKLYEMSLPGARLVWLDIIIIIIILLRIS
jgi:hypothetical protein